MSNIGEQTGIQFSSNDAWIFLATLLSAGPGERASLREIIGAADYLNHAIPTLGELDDAFDRLLRAGLIDIDDMSVQPTEIAQTLYADRRGDGRSLTKHMDALAQALGAGGWRSVTTADDPTQCKVAGLNRQRYAEACDAYRNRTGGS